MMGSDGENTFQKIFQQNLSNGTRAVTRNHLLRSLVSQQKTGTVEKFGEFKAVVYCLSGSQTSSICQNQSAHCNESADVAVAVGTNMNQRSERNSHSHRSIQTPSKSSTVARSRGTPSNQLSTQASLLIANTTTTDGAKLNALNMDTDDSVTTEEGSSKILDGNASTITGNNASKTKNLRSTIFMVDDCNHIYRLSFHTTNVNIVSLAFNDAALPIPENEKCTQAHSRDHYAMKYLRNHSRELNYVHFYELCYSEPKEQKKERSIMPKTTSNIVKKENENISSPQKRPTIASQIYVSYEDFRLCLFPTTLLRIDRVSVHKPKKCNEDPENQVSKQASQPLPTDDCLQTGGNYYNIDSANLTVFQNNDVYNIVFSLSDCVLERIIPFHQLGTTTPLPDLVYCRVTSLTSHKRFIYAPLPRSTYYYCNPMRRIVYKNRHNRLYGLPPEWKSQVMQEKIKQEKKDKYATMLTNANKMGTCRVYFAANNIHIRVRSKAMKMLVDDGEDAYDKWIIKEKHLFSHIPEGKQNYPNNACRFCHQFSQGTDAKSPMESVETKEDESTLKN